MVGYKFWLKIKNVPHKYVYDLDLDSYQEDNPECIFTAEVRENLRNALQNQSLCAIKDKHLNQIISAWIEDIREGYRTSELTLDLPLLIESNVEQIQDEGNQHLPEMLSPEISAIEPQWGMLPPLGTIFQD